MSVLPSLVVLGIAALAALWLARNRRSPIESVAERRAAARVLVLSVGIQSIHFVEELATGFHGRLGALLGLPGMPLSVFIVFNVMWIGIWIAAVPGLRSSRAAAFFASWFLAIAGMFNGIAHPLLALASDGYFPGLVSSPVIASVSIWLWLRLRRATRPVSVAGPSHP